MKIPKTLKIGGHEYKVLFPYNFRELSNTNGQIDPHLKEIRLCGDDGAGNKRTNSATLVTLLHEILHGIDRHTGHRIFDSENGEKVIEGFSEGLYQVLKDNKLNFGE